jgi:hypothetical protein
MRRVKEEKKIKEKEFRGEREKKKKERSSAGLHPNARLETAHCPV